MSGILAQIEQALVARLARLTLSEAGYSLTVTADGGPLTAERAIADSGLSEAVIDDSAITDGLSGPLPLARVSFIEAEAEGGTLAVTRFKARFQIDLLTRNPRTAAAARHGSGAEVGVWQVMADVAALLTGATLGLEIAPCRVERLRAVHSPGSVRQRLAVLSLEVMTHFAVAARPLPEDGDIGEFLALHVEWTGRDEADTGPVPHPDPAQTTPQLIEVRP